MLGEDYEEEFDTNRKEIFKQKSKSNLTNNSQNDYLDLSTNRSREGKKDRSKKHKKKSSCDNCKALNQKINELEQLNEELLKIKEKLSKSNEELSAKNEELIQTNKSIINKNKELLSLNKQLKEENNELIKEKTGYKTEISGLRKQLMSRVSSTSKDKDITQNNDININKQDNKTNAMNVEIMSLNSDSIPPKKEDIITNKLDANINSYMNDIKYCTVDDYNELKTIVEELQEKVNILEKWKKNFSKLDRPKKKSKDRINIFTEYDKRENSIKHGSRKITIDTDDKLSKSVTLEQKVKTNNGTETNSSSNNNNNSIMNKSFTKKDKDKKNKEIEKVKNKNQRFNSKIITNVEDLDLIARGLVRDDLDSLKNLRVGYKLIYRATEHGDEAEDFHERCDDYEGSLIIIKTKDGNIFGGYTSLSWDPEDEAEKKDEYSFVFSLNLDKLYFESGKKEYSIFCDRNKGPCFVGMFAVQEHILKSKSYINPWGIQCFSGENSDYEINQGKSDFFIEELEVFQVIVKKS